MKKLIILSLAVLFSSCEERVKIIELQGVKVDTSYQYKVERAGEDGKVIYDHYVTKYKLNEGDYVLTTYP